MFKRSRTVRTAGLGILGASGALTSRDDPLVRWAAILLLAATSLTWSTCAQAARLALVVGNDLYQHVPTLRNARADAHAMGSALKQAGYAVDVRVDLGLQGMQSALREFKARVQPRDEVVVFFSGHGVQIENTNFLLPTDIRSESAAQVRDDGIPLQRILDDLAERQPRFSLVIVDACRNNPFKGRGRAIGGRGLSSTAPANGQMVIYSAGTDQEALDRLSNSDPSPNGLFTRVFLKQMLVPGLPVRQVLQNVRESVFELARSVNHTQMPAVYDQALGSFYFVPLPPGSASGPATSPAAGDISMWTSLKNSRDTVAIQGYLSAYPNGLFVDAARARLEALGAAATSPVGAVPRERGQTFKHCESCPAMVVIPPGSLVRGHSGADQPPAETFNLTRQLAVGVYEVTFREWDACVADGACQRDIADQGWGRDSQPVVNVNWHDTRAFVDWLSKKSGRRYRLLREAEWEYAARAGSVAAYPWGRDAGFDNANCLQCGAAGFSGKRPAPVGKFNRNAFGLYDVIGNVWEWVEDCDSPYVKSANAVSVNDVSCSARVLRGGSFRTAALEATVHGRRPGNATVRSAQNGFRVACELD